MKKIILMTIMISTILISCGGGSGASSNDGNQKKNIIKYKLEKTSGLTNKEVYLITSFTDLEDSNYYDLNVTGKSTSILTKKSVEYKKNKEGIRFVDIGSKFRENSPKLEKKVMNSWIYVNILDTIFFVFYEYFFSNSIGLKYPNLL